MSIVRRSLLYAFGSTYLSSLLNLLSSLYIARALTPKEIGLFSIAAAISAIASQFRGMGLNAYIVQEKELTRIRIRTASGVLMITSWSVGLLMYISSGLIAQFFQQPPIGEILRVLAVSFIFVPIGGITLSLLTRDMRFAITSGLEVASAVCSVSTAVTLAYFGFGYLSLAWASVAGIVALALLSQFFRPAGMPLFPSLQEWRRVVRFGFFSTGGYLIGQIRGSSYELIVGKLVGPTQLAFLVRAGGLAGFIATVVGGGIQKVFFSHLANEIRAERDIEALYLRVISCTTGLAWPIFAVLAILGGPIVLTLYGPQWISTVEIVRFTAISTALGVPFWLFAQILNAYGMPQLLMKYQAGLLALAIVMAISIAPFGIYALAVASVPYGLVTGAIMWRLLRPLVGFSWQSFFDACKRSIVLTVLCSAGAFVCLAMLGDVLPDWGMLLLGVAVSAFLWLSGVFLIDHPLAAELKLIRNLRFRAR